MKKDEALALWRDIKKSTDRSGSRINPLDRMEALPHPCPKGSRFGTDSIRIGGSPGFINAVLSCLTDLLDGENEETYLNITRHRIKDLKQTEEYKKEYPLTADDAEILYIHLHERGTKRPRKPGA